MSPHTCQYSFIDSASNVATKRGFEKLSELLLQLAGGRKEDEQRHSEFKVFQEVRVCSSAGSELRRRKTQGRCYIRLCRRGT